MNLYLHSCPRSIQQLGKPRNYSPAVAYPYVVSCTLIPLIFDTLILDTLQAALRIKQRQSTRCEPLVCFHQVRISRESCAFESQGEANI